MIQKFNFEGYIIRFDDSIKHEIFSEEWYYGIHFYVNGSKYELVHNFVGMTRLIINHPEWHWSDIPFHMGTAKLLPEGIEVIDGTRT